MFHIPLHNHGHMIATVLALGGSKQPAGCILFHKAGAKMEI
jgi:hypothetical protein